MTKNLRTPEALVVASLGEALFDCFLDRTTLGGAPVNFIVHVQQVLATVDGRGVLVSRVGDDSLGAQLISALECRGVPVNLVQRDPLHATGQVQVEISPSGDPEYDIVDNAAWDHLAFGDSLELLAASCNAVCFGTLAQRRPTSRTTIHRFLDLAPQALRVLDVNLRQQYITPSTLESSLAAANVVKLNEAELYRVGELLPDRLTADRSVDDRAFDLLHAFDLKLLALTRGSRGTVLYRPSERLEGAIVRARASAHADDVGAGDACCAGLVFGLLMQWPLDRTLDLANRMGAFVASQPGGTPRLPSSLLEFAAAEQV